MRSTWMRCTVVICALAAACGEGKNEPKPGTHTLTVAKAGTGAGTVSATGIACGTDCSEAFADGTTVTLAAAPAGTATFGGWAGCDAVNETSCTVTIAADRTVTATFTAPSGTVITVSADLTTAATWQTGNTYLVTKPIHATAPLTIQPGVTVKFAPGASLEVSAALIADGQSAATPIVFTSANASPSGGDWAGLRLRAGGSTLNQCAVLYTGADDTAGLSIDDGIAATVTHCTFAHHRTPTDSIDGRPALDASGAAAGTVVSDNLFFDNRVPLQISALFSPGVNTFDNAAAAPNAPQPSKYNAIFVAGCSHVKAAVTWPPQAVPYVIGDSSSACNYLEVDSTAQLTLGSTANPAVVKFHPHGRIHAAGLINARAVFTSVRDDRQAGDTNGDGTASAPAGGDWAGVSVSRSGSVFNQCTFHYTGDGESSALQLNAYAATVTNSVFAHHRPATASIRSAPALDASDSPAGTVVQSNLFFDTTVPLAVNTTYSVDDSNTFQASEGATPTRNTFQAIVVRGCSAVASNVTWSAVKVPYVIGDPSSACNYLTVSNGGRLTLADTVVLKFFGHGRLVVEGTLSATAATTIVFTAFADDAHGGDTNADGATSTPLAGSWDGINVRASGSVFDRVQFLYAGGAADGDSVPALDVASGKTVTVTNSVFAHVRTAEDTLHAPPALDLSEAAPGTVFHDNRLYDCTVPMGINANLSLDDSNAFDSGVTTAPQPSHYQGVQVRGCGAVQGNTSWTLTKVPLVIGDAVSACNYLTVSGAAQLAVGPNVTMKFFTDGSITVSVGGSLAVDATAWLTCICDDHVTDTNADNGAETPAMGHWHGIKRYHSGASPTCDVAGYLHWNTPNNASGCAW